MNRTAWIKKREKSLMRILARQCMEDKEMSLNDTTPQEPDYQGFLSFMRSVIPYTSIPFPQSPHDKDSLYLKFIFRDYGFFLQLLNIYKLFGEMEEKNFLSHKPLLVAYILKATTEILNKSWLYNHHNHIDRVFRNWYNRQQQREGGAGIGA